MATRRKKQVKTSPAHNVEVYDHVDDEIGYIKSNEITIPEQIFAWVLVALIFILSAYMIL